MSCPPNAWSERWRKNPDSRPAQSSSRRFTIIESAIEDGSSIQSTSFSSSASSRAAARATASKRAARRSFNATHCRRCPPAEPRRNRSSACISTRRIPACPRISIDSKDGLRARGAPAPCDPTIHRSAGDEQRRGPHCRTRILIYGGDQHQNAAEEHDPGGERKPERPVRTRQLRLPPPQHEDGGIGRDVVDQEQHRRHGDDLLECAAQNQQHGGGARYREREPRRAAGADRRRLRGKKPVAADREQNPGCHQHGGVDEAQYRQQRYHGDQFRAAVRKHEARRIRRGQIRMGEYGQRKHPKHGHIDQNVQNHQRNGAPDHGPRQGAARIRAFLGHVNRRVPSVVREQHGAERGHDRRQHGHRPERQGGGAHRQRRRGRGRGRHQEACDDEAQHHDADGRTDHPGEGAPDGESDPMQCGKRPENCRTDRPRK